MKFKIGVNAKKLLKKLNIFQEDLQYQSKEALDSTVMQVKRELSSEIHKEIERVRPDAAQREGLNPPKSIVDKIIDKQVVGASTWQKDRTGAYYNDLDSGENFEAFAIRRGSGGFGGYAIRGRVNIADGDNHEEGLSKFKEKIRTGVVSVPDKSGKMQHYISPGGAREDYVLSLAKIVCSRYKADASTPGDHNIGQRKGEEKFERDFNKRGYAEFTIKQKGLEYIQKNWTNITPSVDAVKYGDIDQGIDKLAGSIAGAGTRVQKNLRD